MRLAIALLLLVLSAMGAVWLIAGQDEIGPQPAGVTPDAAAEQPRAPTPDLGSDTHRDDVSPKPVPQPPAEAATPAKPIAVDPNADEPSTAPPANVVITVRAADDQRAIAPFRWRFTTRDTAALFGDVDADHVELTLPDGMRGELMIEAPGMQPFRDEAFVVPAAGAAARQLNVQLDAAMQATGITLHLRDPQSQPVQHVRVDAWRIEPGQREAAWQLGQALWARRTDADDGDYTLPTLAPGEYGIRVLATDPQGALLPLLPYRRAFTVTGSNGFVEDVFFEPACALRIDFVTSGGEVLDPIAHGAVTIGLCLAGAPAQPRMWTVRDDAGKQHSAIDALPQPGTIWLAEPVAGGNYHLEVLVAGEPRLKLPLMLIAGTVQSERVIVP